MSDCPEYLITQPGRGGQELKGWAALLVLMVRNYQLSSLNYNYKLLNKVECSKKEKIISMFYSLGLTGMVTGMLCNNGLGTITLDVNTMSL